MDAEKQHNKVLAAMAEALRLPLDVVAHLDATLRKWMKVDERMEVIESTLDTILTDQQKIRDTQERIEAWQQQRDQRRADES